MPATSKQDINIIPRRLMDSKKAEELVALIKGTDGVAEVEIVKKNYRGGGFLAGRFIIVLSEGIAPEDMTEKLRPVFAQMMPFGYDVNLGVFIKPRATVKDYIREAGKKKDTDQSAN